MELGLPGCLDSPQRELVALPEHVPVGENREVAGRRRLRSHSRARLPCALESNQDGTGGQGIESVLARITRDVADSIPGLVQKIYDVY